MHSYCSNPCIFHVKHFPPSRIKVFNFSKQRNSYNFLAIRNLLIKRYWSLIVTLVDSIVVFETTNKKKKKEKKSKIIFYLRKIFLSRVIFRHTKVATIRAKFPPWHGFSKATFLDTFGLLDFLFEKTCRPLHGSAPDGWPIFRHSGNDAFDPSICPEDFR